MSDMEQRMTSLEGRVGNMEQRITAVEVNVDSFTNLQNRFGTTLDKFDNVLNKMQVSLSEMNTEMKLRNEAQKELKDELKNDIADLKGSLLLVSDKSKFDFIIFMRDKVMPFLAISGIIYFILEVTGKIP